MPDDILGGGPPPVGEREAGEEASQADENRAQDEASAPGDGDSSRQQKKPLSSVGDVPAVRDYLNRIDGRARSFRHAVVEETRGPDGKYKRVVADIAFAENGAVEAPDDYAPTDAEREAITEAFKTVKFPTHQVLAALTDLPPELKHASKDVLFEFRDEQGRIVMLQHRLDKTDKDGLPTGEKAYIPYTYWSDGVWRRLEPPGLLPLWGLDQLATNSIVFLHEGAKAARHAWKIANDLLLESEGDHPWSADLKYAAHLGWIGGALHPERTDWSVLRRKGVKKAYIVSDNDDVGFHAVAKIAKEMPCEAVHVQFTEEWPEGFDLADPFPDKMFVVNEDGGRVYRGPTFGDCLVPATWATSAFTHPAEGRGRPRTTYSIRPDFAKQWRWVVEQEVFVAINFGRVMRPKQFNAAVRPFSHVADTASLFQSHYTGQVSHLTYRPDSASRLVSDRGATAVNMYRPTNIRPVTTGGCQPFLDFLAYMFPVETDRAFVERWIATVVGRPDKRVLIGLLVFSETQGTGKTTLGEVLAELVGRHNASFPGEHSILGQFNSFLENKQLVVVNEIYSSGSWKAYNTLKSYMTDPTVEVNPKGMKQFEIPNWTHYFVCSNSVKALKIDEKDRRWFVPEVTEEKWPRERFGELRAWLSAGGYGRILHWAQTYNHYIEDGDAAPESRRKGEVIRASKAEAWQLAYDLGRLFMDLRDPDPERKPPKRSLVAIRIADVISEVRDELGLKDGDRSLQPAEIAKALRMAGMTLLTDRDRIKVAGRPTGVAMNFSSEELELDEKGKPRTVQSYLITKDKEVFPHIFRGEDL